MDNNEQKMDFGAMSGIIIVVIVLLVGAFYFFGQRMEKSKEFQDSIKLQQATTTSLDDISGLEKDAQSINFDTLGAGIDKL